MHVPLYIGNMDTRFDVAIRLNADQNQRLEAELKRLKRTMPGVGWTRSAVVRMALEQYLTADDDREAAAS
jgi:hypothetical protein